MWLGTQVVREESAKLLCVGSIPTLASETCPGGGTAYAQHLKCCGRKTMWVRIPPRAQIQKYTGSTRVFYLAHFVYI
ncbi:MAG: hypothetical protein UV65_C0026G0008 [Parcubacteria group bacterium GW2011_GWF2_43_11]|nr:MAG: hypothetical protein UV65_C0026G0008 [Parcubacteria group bacterium GW2011_GWF2_43_11]